MLEILVRPARPSDEAFVVALAGRFAESRPDWRDEREVTLGTERELRRAFRDPSPGSVVYIAEHGASGESLGFAYGVVHEDFFTGETHGHLSEIAVVRDGSGAARPLIAAIERHFARGGLRFVTLNVNVDNARAAGVYERLGYAAHVVQMVKVLGT